MFVLNTCLQHDQDLPLKTWDLILIIFQFSCDSLTAYSFLILTLSFFYADFLISLHALNKRNYSLRFRHVWPIYNVCFLARQQTSDFSWAYIAICCPLLKNSKSALLYVDKVVSTCPNMSWRRDVSQRSVIEIRKWLHTFSF